MSADIATQLSTLNQYTFDWLKDAHDKYVVKDFGKVFEKYIHNYIVSHGEKSPFGTAPAHYFV
nr:YvbH-like oligomerization domain-containing protein [Brevibacillus choshinensis]